MTVVFFSILISVSATIIGGCSEEEKKTSNSPEDLKDIDAGTTGQDTDTHSDSNTEIDTDSDTEIKTDSGTDSSTETKPSDAGTTTIEDPTLNDIKDPLCDGPAKNKTRIMIFGDSWATFLHRNATFEAIFKDAGCPHYKITTLEFPGTLAEQWNKDLTRGAIILSLMNNPTVDIVVFSLGGNDFLTNYNIHMADTEKEVFFSEIRFHLSEIAKAILGVRAGIRIIMVGYDFPNFDEALSSSIGMNYYNDIGQPSHREAAEALMLFETNTSRMVADANDRIEFVNNSGLMQWTFGNEKYDLEPYTVPFPTQDSPIDGVFIGGDPDIPSPAKAMLKITGNYVDAIHLNPQGYSAIGRRVVITYMGEWLQE